MLMFLAFLCFAAAAVLSCLRPWRNSPMALLFAGLAFWALTGADVPDFGD
jgi:hypothetical protein